MTASGQESEAAWIEVADEIVGELKRRDARINAQDARIVRLEAVVDVLRKELDAREHKGVWDATTGYLKHNQVTWDGSSWYAVRDTRGRPGTQDSGWRLITKRGRDGKDANRV